MRDLMTVLKGGRCWVANKVALIIANPARNKVSVVVPDNEYDVS
jgi:hypothetical protein